MNEMSAAPRRLQAGERVPDLILPLVGGGVWRLSEQTSENFTLLWVNRGVHCSFCKAEMEILAARHGEFEAVGCKLLVLSMDGPERAAQMSGAWQLADVPVAEGPAE